MSITPEALDYDDYDNDGLDRRALRRRQEDIDLFSSFSNGGGLPPWVTTLVTTAKIVAFIGVPSVIALFLVYQNANWLPKLQAAEVQTESEVESNRKLLDQQIVKQDEIYRLLQRICSNTAKTSDDRQRCFDN